MKKSMRLIVLWVAANLLGTSVRAEESLNLVPVPQTLKHATGKKLVLTSDTSMGFGPGIQKEFALHCAGLLREATGWKVPVARQGTIAFALDTASPKGTEEGYRLTVLPNRVQIKASTQKGLFYGFQTLRQLMPPAAFGSASAKVGAWEVPLVQIDDAPRYAWRGLLVDVSRKFQTPETIKKMLDAMAACKLNTFHWHLTDDQGWRIEIKKYPKLTQLSKEFYTQDEVREIVKYARLRNIQIVPEIDVPGHSRAATRAYPELACRNAEGDKLERSGTYCPGESAVYAFLEEVLAEVSALFPAPYIHLGADEVGRGNWNKCPDCQKTIKEKNLKGSHGLEVYFVQQMVSVVQGLGKTAITWDEALNDETSKDQVIMSWRGMEPGMKAAEAGHKVVLCPVSVLYFDRRNSRSKHQNPGYSINTVNLHLPYFFEPQSPLLAKEAQPNILGAQGCIWGERIQDDKHLMMQAMLRGCALAEATWSGAEHRDWSSFLARVEVHAQRLDAMQVAYFWEPMSNAIEVFKIQPGTITAANGTLSIDLGQQIKGNGMYEFTFHRYHGEGTFKVSNVDLLKNGRKIDSDGHVHVVTIDSRKPTQFYHLWVRDYDATAKYSLQVSAEVVAPDEFLGVVMLVPLLPEKEYDPKTDPETKCNGHVK